MVKRASEPMATAAADAACKRASSAVRPTFLGRARVRGEGVFALGSSAPDPRFPAPKEISNPGLLSKPAYRVRSSAGKIILETPSIFDRGAV